MELWHRLIDQDPNKVIDAVTYFNNELKTAIDEVNISGSIVKMLQTHPFCYEHRYGQWQQLETIVEVLENKQKNLKSTLFKKYTTNTQRMITSTDAMKYVEGDNEYVTFAILISEIVYIRERFAGVVKALEQKYWALSTIAKLRTAGIEDACV